MKHLLLPLAAAGTLIASAASVSAQSTTLSDFSAFTPDGYSAAFDGEPWSELTSVSGATSFTIGGPGGLATTGAIGNAFSVSLGATPLDFAGYDALALTGFALPENATSSLYVVLNDAFGSSVEVEFDLSLFSASPATVVMHFDPKVLDLTAITGWQVEVRDFSTPGFAFEFDHLVIGDSAAIPEPSTWAAIAAGVALLTAVWRRRR